MCWGGHGFLETDVLVFRPVDPSAGDANFNIRNNDRSDNLQPVLNLRQHIPYRHLGPWKPWALETNCFLHVVSTWNWIDLNGAERL